MGHDPSKVILGATLSSIKESGNRKGLVAAGLAARQKADGTISTSLADGSLLGISIGRDQSGTDRTSIAFRGLDVPIQLAASFTPVAGTVVYIDNATGKAKASATDATAVNATYSAKVPVLKSGIPEGGGAPVPCAYIDFAGGL